MESAEALAARVRGSFESQGMLRTLRASLESVEPGRVVVRVPFDASLTQQDGFFHAGVTSTIADTAGGYAGYTMFAADASVLTVEFKINLVRPAIGQYLEAVGKVVKAGRTLTITTAEVFAQGQERTLVAVCQQTLIQVRAGQKA
jgi:uncharacterized protein (TIGR00369 family)